MATTSLQSLHHRLLHRKSHRHSSSSFPCTDSSLFLKHTTNQQKLFSNLSSSSSLTTPSPLTPSSTSSSFDLLVHHLSSNDFRQADDETRRLLIVLAGEAAQKRGYVFFSEVQFIPASDLQAIDRLWLEHSGGRFGYSVQRRIWENVRRDFSRFFLKLGWMKKLDTEVEQYNYRSFPDEFLWELKDDAPPQGHLPLTNALRGTQLLCSILTHPAFDEIVAAEDAKEESAGGVVEEEEQVALNEVVGSRERPKKPIYKKPSLKPDYSF